MKVEYYACGPVALCHIVVDDFGREHNLITGVGEFGDLRAPAYCQAGNFAFSEMEIPEAYDLMWRDEVPPKAAAAPAQDAPICNAIPGPMGNGLCAHGRAVSDHCDACADDHSDHPDSLLAKSIALLRELIDIEGPQPGTAAWADKVRAFIAEVTGEPA